MPLPIRPAFALLGATLLCVAGLAATAAPAPAAPPPPETTITDAPDDAVADGRARFAFEADEQVLRFECRVDDQVWRTCTSPHTTAPQPQGDHVFRVRAIDLDGTPDETPAEALFVVDKSIAGVNAAARRSQRVGDRPIRIRIEVTAAENAIVSARGGVRAGKRRVRLTGAAVAVPAGTLQTIVLRPQANRDSGRIRKQIRRRGSALATMTATFTDFLGNSATTGAIETRLKR